MSYFKEVTIIDYFIMDQNKINPDTKISLLTKRVTQILSEKYHFTDLIEDQTQNISDQTKIIDEFQIQQAYNQSERMTVKLKQIRTMLGYEQTSNKSKNSFRSIQRDNKKEEKGINLKNFVMSMRKRNQTLRHSGHYEFNHIKKQTEQKTEDHALKQYTDTSLKFTNSFLPHQTLFEQHTNRPRKTYSENKGKINESLNRKSIQDFKELEEFNRKLLQSPLATEHYSYSTPTRDKDHLIKKIEYSPTISKIEPQYAKSENSSVQMRKSGGGHKKQTYSTINVEPNRQQYAKERLYSRKLTSPIDFLSGKFTDIYYKAKHTHKQILKSERKQLYAQPRLQLKDQIKRIVPVILPCLPRQKQT